MSSRWPLTCTSCGRKVWVGQLYGDGWCTPCHRQHYIVTMIEAAKDEGSVVASPQSSLGEFA